MKLCSLGWSDFFAYSFNPYAAQGYHVGRVAIAYRDQYQLLTENGDRTAIITGKFRHQIQSLEEFPAVGDWVVIESDKEPALIHKVLPRKSQFMRQVAGARTEAQIIAANLDTVFLISGLDHDFNLRRIERYLVMIWESKAIPVIVLNKADLCDEPEEKIRAVEEVAIAVPIIALSALTQDNLESLQPYLRSGQTIALLGSSGVGKSTLTNQLMGQVIQSTQAVRADDSRGRHTTTHREMVHLPSGALLIDTPGMRELQLWDTGDSLKETFADIEAFAEDCRFRDCQHQSEPGCAIQEAIADGTLSSKRLASYRKLQKEQDYLHRRKTPQAQHNSKKRWKAITKSSRKNSMP